MGLIRFASGDIYDYLDDFDSPELTFKGHTLKEAVFEALEKLDVIPRLKLVDDELQLDLDDVNKLVNLINSENDFTTRIVKQDINEYATEMESELLNATNLSDNDEATEVFPAKGLFSTLRSSEFYFDLTKSYIELPKRINKINKLNIFTPRIIVSDGASTEYYNANNKFVYYANKSSFPTTGETDIYYVAIDGTPDGTSDEEVYTWSGSAYVDLSEVANDTFPKIRFLDTFSDFSSIDQTGRALDVWVDMENKVSYGYDTSFYELEFFDGYGNLVVDATDRVLERRNYQTLDVDTTVNIGGGATDDRYNPDNFFQSNTIFYDYRDTKIYTGNTTGLFDTLTAISILYKIKVYECLYSDGLIPSTKTYDEVISSNYDADDGDLTFQVWYTPIPVSMRVNVDRGDLSDVNRYSTMLANQGRRILELSNVLDNMEGKINKIGNSDMQLEFPVYDVSDLYDVGDYTSDGYVITNAEFIYYRDYIYAKYDLTKNYNRLSQLIGVNSEVRQWDMGEQNTLQRKLMYSEYVEIDVNANTDAPNGSNTSNLVKDYGKNAYLSTLDITSNYDPIRSGMFVTEEADNYLLAGFSSNGGGNSLEFEMQLPNNVSAGDKLVTETNWISSRKGRDFVSYTDDNGKCNDFQIKLFDEFDYSLTEFYDINTLGDNLPNTDDSYIKNEYIGNDDNGKFTIYKDNREEIGFTYTIKSVVKDYNKIILGNKLFNRNSLVTENPPTGIDIYLYDEEVFDKTTTRLRPEGYTSTATASLTFDYTNNKVTVGNTLTGSKSYCLTDEDGYILLAVNQGEEVLNTFTFDFINKRSDINYNY